MSEQFARGSFRVLGTLEDYLPDIVVGGGWAPCFQKRSQSGSGLFLEISQSVLRAPMLKGRFKLSNNGRQAPFQTWTTINYGIVPTPR